MKSWRGASRCIGRVNRLDLNVLESVGLLSIHLHLFRDILRQLWYDFGTNLGRIWDIFGTTMGQLRDSSGASCWLLSGYWKSVSVASGQHRPQILFLIWCLNWLIYVDYMIMATDTIPNLMPKLVDLWFRRLQKTVAPKGPETAQFPLYKIYQPPVLGFNNCPQFWLKLKPLVVQMVSCDRAHVSTCPLIFQYYSSG